jgi:tetratricopeptide (TPR) repeat protein
MEKAINALHAKNALEAEVHLRKALEIQGDDPVLLNNLAIALQMQGKQAESDSIADQIPARFPDYFFGQVISVRRALKAKQLEKAKITLDKMMTKPELHVTEFSALCACQIDFFLADEKPEGAISWFEMWEQGYQDDPNREKYQTTITMLKALSKLSKGFPGRRHKEKTTNLKND